MKNSLTVDALPCIRAEVTGMARPVAAHRRKSHIRNGLLAGLCLLAAPVWAQNVQIYLNNQSAFPGVPGFTEQDGKTRFSEKYETPDGSIRALGSVEVSTRPAPYVISSVAVYDQNYLDSFTSTGLLSYSIEINGAANTFVPVNFRGVYDFSGAAYRRSGVDGYFNFGDSSFNLAGGTDNASGTDHQWVYQNQEISFSESTSTHSQRAGSFFGSASFLTDGNGHATAPVYLGAGANKIYGALGISIQASAFIDPEFSIDPVWLAANPGATLTFPAGVGNAVVQAVPEPETYALMLAGLGLVGAAVRRRKDRVAGPRLAAAPHATNPRSCESAA